MPPFSTVAYAVGPTKPAIVLRDEYALLGVDEKPAAGESGYLDPHYLNLGLRGRSDTLVVERAGRDLYLVEPHDD